MKQIFNQSEAGTTQIWVVTHHEYGIFTLIPQTLFRAGNQWQLCALLAVLSSELRGRRERIDFALPLLLAIQTTCFSLDRTRHSHKRNQKTVFTGSSCRTLLIKTLTLTSSLVKTSFQEKHRAVASSCLVLILAFFFWKKRLIEKIILRKNWIG